MGSEVINKVRMLVILGILYKADPDRDRDLQKSGYYPKNCCISERLIFEKFEGAHFKYDNSFLKL